MEVQPQLVLLQKTLLYVEGLGRQLYPQLDLWDTAKPFLEQWMSEQLGPQAFLLALKERAPFWVEKMPELPELIYDTLRQGRQANQRMESMYRDFMRVRQRQNRARFLLGVGGTFMVTSAILYGNQIVFLAQLSSLGTAVSWLLAWRLFSKS